MSPSLAAIRPDLHRDDEFSQVVALLDERIPSAVMLIEGICDRYTSSAFRTTSASIAARAGLLMMVSVATFSSPTPGGSG